MLRFITEDSSSCTIVYARVQYALVLWTDIHLMLCARKIACNYVRLQSVREGRNVSRCHNLSYDQIKCQGQLSMYIFACFRDDLLNEAKQSSSKLQEHKNVILLGM